MSVYFYCVGNVIVNMEKYIDNGKVITFNYERSKGSMNFQHAKSHEPNHRNIGSNGNGSQFCNTQEDLKDPDLLEHIEDVVEAADTNKWFYKKEITKIRRNEIQMGYLDSPLKQGDVIYGPSGDNRLWIVSKKSLLRRTYRDYHKDEIAINIKIECGQIFHVGERLHYAAYHMKNYILVAQYMDPQSLINELKYKNKQKRKRELMMVPCNSGPNSD